MTNSLTTVWLSDYDFGVSMCDIDLELWHTAQSIDDMNAEGVQGSRLNKQQKKLAHLEFETARLMEALNLEEGSLIQLDGQIVVVLKDGWLCDGQIYAVSEAYELFAHCEEAA